MFGLRDRARRQAARAPRQTRTSPFGVWNCAAMMPGRAVRGDPLDLDVLERRLDGLAEPLADPLRVAGDLEARQRPVAGLPPVDGVQLVGAEPLMKNGSCGSEIRPLTPICFQSSSVPSGRCRLPATASRPSRFSTVRDVVDRDDPAEPAAAERGAGAHGLAERRLVGGRVVEHLDDLEVGVVGQRQDHVAGAEAGVDATVDERHGRAAPRCAGRCRRGRRGRRRS